jgi:hypothetical protein
MDYENIARKRRWPELASGFQPVFFAGGYHWERGIYVYMYKRSYILIALCLNFYMTYVIDQ